MHPAPGMLLSARLLLLDLLEDRAEPLWCQFDLPQDLADQRPGEIAARMVRHGRGPAVRVSEEVVTTPLPHGDESEVEQYRLHRAEVDYGEPAHRASSICCTPTKRG